MAVLHGKLDAQDFNERFQPPFIYHSAGWTVAIVTHMVVS